MNFLFGALLLILLLFPGIAFRAAYLRLSISSKSFKSSFLEELLFSLAPAFLFQILGYAIAEGLFNGVNERLLYLLLINSDKAADAKLLSLRAVVPFAGYVLLIAVVAAICGRFLRQISLRYGWHFRYNFFRIYNEWDIYFRALILDRNSSGHRSSTLSKVWIDVLVENKNDSYIYSGTLVDYIVDRDEKLDRIYLSGVRRRAFTDAKPAEEIISIENAELDTVDYSDVSSVAADEQVAANLNERYYYMPGEYFVLPGSQIKNINIIYYGLGTDGEGDDDATS